MTDDIDNDGTTLHESGGVGLRGFPPRILKLLEEVAGRNSTPSYGPWEDGEGEPLQDDADAALRWIAACPHGDGWVSVKERLPARWTEVLIWPRPSDYCHVGQLVMNEAWECHEYETGFGDVARRVNVTHWQALPAAPTTEDRSQS